MKTNKVIFHFLQGMCNTFINDKVKCNIDYENQTCTFNNCYVDCYVDWANNKCTLLIIDGNLEKYDVDVTNVIAIEQQNTHDMSIFANPKYALSVYVNIMTAKQRARLNNFQRLERHRTMDRVLKRVRANQRGQFWNSLIAPGGFELFFKLFCKNAIKFFKE